MRYFVLLLLSFNVYSEIYKINPDHSSIKFKVSYMKISDVEGRFSNFLGSIHFNTQTERLEKIAITVYPETISTANKMRDRHLKSKDFFDVKTFNVAQLMWNGSEVLKKNSNKTVNAKLVIKNITKDVLLNIKYIGQGFDTWNNETHFFEYNFSINRYDFELKWNKTTKLGNYLVGEDVEISGLIQAQPNNVKTQGSSHMIPVTKGTLEYEKINRGELPRKEIILNKPKKPFIIPSIENTDSLSNSKPTPLMNNISFIILSLFAAFGALGASYMLSVKVLKNDNKENSFKDNFVNMIAVILLSVVFIAIFNIMKVIYDI